LADKAASFPPRCHSAEHWIVVKGAARVRLGDEERFVPEGDGIFIPKNVPCRLENCGRIALEIVSVLEGEYLGEGEGDAGLGHGGRDGLPVGGLAGTVNGLGRAPGGDGGGGGRGAL